MGCATGTIKYSLIFFNILWAILGLMVIVFGGLGWDAMPQNYAIGTILLGGVIFFISFFGCIGAVRESARTLWTCVILLLVLAGLIIVFMCFNTRNVFKQYALKGVEELWSLEKTNPGAMDTMQQTYSCCGHDSAQDYILLGRSPPSSCCKDSNCINPLNLYLDGCVSKVEEAFADEATFSKYYEWGLLGFDLLLLILATMLAIHYRNRKRRFNY